MTLAEHLRDARRTLERAGISPHEATIDADVLARHALGGWDRGRLIAHLRDEAPPEVREQVTPLIARRARREPTAYITGTREFWGLRFRVTRDTLIPRPETEGLVEAAVARATPSPRIADICTGSGCIAVALAHDLAGARVTATDLSPGALAVAATNAAAHGVADRVAFVRGDLMTGLAGPFDLVVSNPPYVSTADIRQTQPEVQAFEPHLALDGGQDGLDLIRRLVPQAAARLAPRGWLVFEFGVGQADDIHTIVGAEPRLTHVGILADLAGIPRIAMARRRED